MASAVMLAVYIAIAVHAGASPSSDPQQGMAQGFIIFAVLILAVLGCILWFATARNHPWLMRAMFVLTVLPAISMLAQHLFLLLRST